MNIKIKSIKEITTMQIRVGLIGLLTFLSLPVAMASPEQERVYDLQLLHQIDAIELTVLAAQKEHSFDTRLQFHYTAFRDQEGKLHNGVLEDLRLIRAGIAEHLSEKIREPRIVVPIQGDYLGDRSHQESHHE
jgi:RAQPRD family integrative conjugative element protein